MIYKICVILPTYNHYQALPSILASLKKHSLDVLIVNDGSHHETREALTRFENTHVRVAHLTPNQGKGAALKYGLRWAHQLGYTHAFQIDADGQHDLTALHSFLTTSKQNPDALISGQPQYDASAPLARRLGRWMTNIWVWVETLSLRVKESMCGFRIYPLSETLAVLNKTQMGQRMEFDTEVLVRLFWRGTPCIMRPVKVTYPKDNASTFDVFWDNWRITKMHTRLVFEMLFKLPRHLKHRPNYHSLNLPVQDTSWFKLREQGTFLGISVMFYCYRICGRQLSKVIAAPVLFYFVLFGKKQRQASRQYLNRVFAFSGQAKTATLLHTFSHYLNFLEMMLDKLSAWTGKLDTSHINQDNLQSLRHLTSQKKGGLFFVSHLGSIDVLRACASFKKDSKLHVLMHSKNAQNFGKLLQKINLQSSVNILEVTQVGPDTILYLQERIQAGEWVAIAADRIPVTGSEHVTLAPFLGHEAPFPKGAYILASLLGCPVHTLWIVRTGRTFKLFVDKFEEKIVLQRPTREKSIEKYVKKYSKLLEKYCLEYPYQWFNFYPYWNKAHE